jgi:hypothetical protein
VGLGVMGLVEDKKTDFRQADERMHQALYQNFCSANNDHILGAVIDPSCFTPQARAHGATDGCNRLIKAALQNIGLLEDEVDRVDLGMIN